MDSAKLSFRFQDVIDNCDAAVRAVSVLQQAKLSLVACESEYLVLFDKKAMLEQEVDALRDERDVLKSEVADLNVRMSGAAATDESDHVDQRSEAESCDESKQDFFEIVNASLYSSSMSFSSSPSSSYVPSDGGDVSSPYVSSDGDDEAFVLNLSDFLSDAASEGGDLHAFGSEGVKRTEPRPSGQPAQDDLVMTIAPAQAVAAATHSSLSGRKRSAIKRRRRWSSGSPKKWRRMIRTRRLRSILLDF